MTDEKRLWLFLAYIIGGPARVGVFDDFYAAVLKNADGDATRALLTSANAAAAYLSPHLAQLREKEPVE